MKKINFKQPKYIAPLIVLLPLLFLIYNVSNMFAGGTPVNNGVTDSINTALPEADEQYMEGKMDAMDKSTWGDGYTAIYRLGEENEASDEASHGYSEEELDKLDRLNAERQREAKEREELERTLQESQRHINRYQGYDPSPSRNTSQRSQYDEIEEYANTLNEIQNRNRRRNQSSSSNYDWDEFNSSETTTQETPLSPQKKETPPEIVYKTPEKDADKFHTLTPTPAADAALIKAIIDKTTKVRNGTRLRFKLLDDVMIKGVALKKGTYLYGVVDGFNGQRVMASITSILINDKFVKVNLSVYDNDGMEGFYVPASVFRTFVKDAGSNVTSNGMSFNNSSTEISGEAMALQALQNIYSSASNAVSNNIKQDKARIKYNTTVYLINASQTEDQ